MTFRTTFRETRKSRQIALIVIFREKYARRILAIVSTISISNSASQTTRRPVWTLIPGVPIGCRSPRKRGPYSMPNDTFKKVKANRGAAGVDGQSIAEFETALASNLYRLWNRLSSGSYFPPPVRRVDIPKASGGTRPLGIPTVADRVAQEVVRRYLEPRLEPVFHADSYGYRPGRSAIDAVRTTRQRCWRYDWVLDIDIKAFFDSARVASQGAPDTHGLPMGAALCEALVEGAD